MRPQTDIGDFNIKLGKAKGFLEERNKVKVTVQFRGREMAYRNFGFDLLKRVEAELTEIAKVEFSAKVEGRNMFMIFAPR